MKKDDVLLDTNYKFNKKDNNDISDTDEIDDMLSAENLDKQEFFDRFLTYRRRMARLAAVQALYLYDFRVKSQSDVNVDIFGTNKAVDSTELCQDIIYFYRNVFFTQQEYGWTKKTKKIDESFMFELVDTSVHSIENIDDFIQQHLSGNWTVDKLDYILRAIIRCAIAEILVGIKIEKAVLCSEYTNLAGNFFSSKEIGFVNGIVDKLYTTVTKIYPFIDRKVIKDETNENKQ